ncbi:MAG TPA: WYL domain-containing transcriptional regulator [Acidobacteriota bacterium]|nr:WYL domain-containing transcriptional regulator [Acidobacteriota bacterium]
MQPRRDPDQNYGQKLIRLFALLFFSQRRYSLGELAEKLNCSKQSVLRLIRDVGSSVGVPVEEETSGRQKYYRIRAERVSGALPMTDEEWRLLEMCGVFARHLLGSGLFAEAEQGLVKSRALVKGDGSGAEWGQFAALRTGTIDFTPHEKTIRTLIKGMEKKRVCRVTYRAVLADRPKPFYVKPLKLFAYADSVYLLARMAKKPGKRYRESDFDPILAVHRIRDIELTDTLFERPKAFDFEKSFGRTFGLIKGQPFTVEVEFWDWAAEYVAERVWSTDQKIKQLATDRIRPTFSSAFEPEVLRFVLSFGDCAKVLAPDWLVNRVRETAKNLGRLYAH